ncbi:MAG: sulfite exporter TauE/SafE family protein [Bacteroidales bacterium]|nr:sulfite exporter TauE/SafE family protein [Alistipes sp.]MBR3939082.1 sulfite exporter TauE/SafE family protein [Bacteroidales bacterium]
MNLELLLILSGLVVGFVNTLSAGGTAISISLYLTLGLPVDVVNATNRVGVLIQSIASSATYHSKKVLDYKKALLLAIPTTLGAFCGSSVAVQATEVVIRYTMLAVLLMMIVFLFKNPKKLEVDADVDSKLTIKEFVVYFLIGIYGGFIQVGTGFFLIMAGVGVVGWSLVKTNAAKVMIMLIYTMVSVLVFSQKGGLIRWDIGLLHGIGCAVGSIVGTLIGIKKGSKFVKWVSVGVIIFTILILFDVVDLKSVMSQLL